jgi:MFS superfamily sulfate permease-like transporter
MHPKARGTLNSAAASRKPHRWPDFRFNLQEIAGAVGDYGTLIPIVLGMALVSDIRLGPVLLCFAVWYIITGICYRMPVPVEPMKVVGAIVIAERLTHGTIVASAIVLGVAFLVVGCFGGMRLLQKHVPRSVVRGIQLGLAVILARTALGFIGADVGMAILCLVIILCFLVISRLSAVPDISAIVVLLLGAVVGFAHTGIPKAALMALPRPIIPTAAEFLKGSWALALPQAPLTITNAILATALLMKDLVGRDVKPDSLSKSIGLMTLTSATVGGIPMCHGAGGLAAQYRFGARTGGSNVISGMILLPIGLFFAGPEFIAAIPVGVFGALLVFVALEIGRHSWKTDSPLVTAIVAILALVLNMTIGFAVGMVVAYVVRRRDIHPGKC